MKRRQIVVDALKIPELAYQLDLNCTDDKCEPDAYDDETIIAEAKYRLDTYFEDGHANNDDMRLSENANERAIARKDIKMLKAFIKKYSK